MSRRQSVSSGAKWESIVGYSRAVRVGNVIHVAGTTAVGQDGVVIGKNDAYAQTIAIIHIIKHALEDLGTNLENVTRTRMFVTNIDDWEEIGRAHGEFFGDIRPASTMVEVSRLINPDLLVEIEVDAVIED